jgi:membrane-associated phospholipid phosphatase
MSAPSTPTAGPATGRGSSSRAPSALLAALVCVLAMAATWVLAHLLPAVQAKDAQALYDFTQLNHPWIDTLANALLYLLDPLLYTVWGVCLVGWAIARRRPRVALAISVVLWIGPLSAELLKPLLAHPHDLIGWNHVSRASWPSGHSTAAMTLALCALLAAPRHRRPAVAAVGSLFAVATGFALLVLAWHMPSDVFGGYLLAALWTSLAVAALRAAERRWPRPRPRPARLSATRVALRRTARQELLVPVVLAAALGALASVLALARTHQLESFAGDHLSLLVAALGIGTLAVLICSTMAAALRR